MPCPDCAVLRDLAESLTIIDRAKKQGLIILSDEMYAQLIIEALHGVINEGIPIGGEA